MSHQRVLGAGIGLWEKGQGKSLEQALDEMTIVAEGVRAARMFVDTADRNGWNTPFLSSV